MNVLVRFANGHIKVKEFDSADVLESIQAILSNIGFENIPEFDEEENYTIGEIVRYGKLVYVFISDHNAGLWDENDVEETTIKQFINVSDDIDTDLDISDESGHVLARFSNGHIKVKNFDSANLPIELENISDTDFDISDD